MKIRPVQPMAPNSPALATMWVAISSARLALTRRWVYSLFAQRSGGGGMADALVSGASVRKDVEVQLLSAAPEMRTVQSQVLGTYIGNVSTVLNPTESYNGLPAGVAIR